MASPGDRIRQDSGSRLVGNRFFKIILQDTLRHKRLLIPGKFIRKRGEGLLNRAILKVPSGLVWVVHVVRDEIGVWFGNGWEEFAESHSLRYGHFLVFNYEGCSRFSVVICDRTATEIEYPVTRNCDRKQTGEGDSQIPEPKVEDLCDGSDDDVPQVNKGKSPMEVAQPRALKKMRGSVSVKNALTGSSWSPVVLPADDGTGATTKRKVGSCSNSTAEQLPPRSFVQGLACNMMELTLKEPSPEENEGGAGDHMLYEEEPSLSRKHKPILDFMSRHPFFDIQMNQKMLDRKAMHVPFNFSGKHIGKDDKAVKLQVGDKTWSVALIRYQSKYVYFSDDWSKFMRENSLKPGDVCIFELVGRLLLNATIFRDAN